MNTIRQVIHRLQTEAEEIGLSMHHAAIIPNPDDDGPDILQAVFAITPKAVEPPKDEEQEAFDKQFEEMMQGEKNVERQEQNKEATEEIRGWLDGKD